MANIVAGTVYDADGEPAIGRTVRAYRRDTGVLLGSGLSSDGVTPQNGDSSYSSVGLLLHGNGANNSTTFTDSGPDNKTVTRNGSNVVISTTQSKYGGAAIYLPGGSGDYLTTAADADFNFGTGDFTIELWFYKTKAGTADFLNWTNSGSTVILLYQFGSELHFWNTAGTNAGVSYSMPVNTWVHMAICRSGTTLRFFINGAQVGSNVTMSDNMASGAVLNIARSWSGGSGREFGGYIDDLRITKGVARYTAAFTAPTEELKGAGTLLPEGEYLIDTGSYTDEVNIICLDDAAGTLENDLIHRAYPVTV